ncbi:MAG: DUF2252 domain-containing protein [Methylococcaceae bacterium]|nr:DUF2252 domain-containing protein [Methylococcaceae bacterium]
MTQSIIERLQAFNQGRDPERLALKYGKMSQDAFAFLRGSCHLFYEDWPKDTPLDDTPAAWICGDLHLENFGSYKGDNRLVYFDINDFDESALAPAAWDLARFLTSVWVAGETLKFDDKQSLSLCHGFIEAYAAELSAGKSRWIERSTAEGMIKDLLKGLKKRSREEFIGKRTWKHDGERRLLLGDGRALKTADEDREKVVHLLDKFAESQEEPGFFIVLDVANRIAGVGSLGVERYVILVKGKGEDGHYLLDLKHQPGSSLQPYLRLAQPKWKNQAERVVCLQERGQAIAPAFLASMVIGQRSYVLRELLPTQDRLSLELWNGKLGRLEKVMDAMGKLVAWSHLRGSGRAGSAIADQWIGFGKRRDWRKPLFDYARAYSQQVKKDWKEFAKVYGEDGSETDFPKVVQV